MSKGRKAVFGTIALFLLITVGKSVAPLAMGAPLRLDVLLPAMLVFILPIRSVRPDGVRLYSALIYRVISRPAEERGRERVVQWWPNNFKPLDEK